MLLTIARIPLSYLEMNFFLQVATMQVWLIWSKGDSVYVLVDFLPPKSYVKTDMYSGGKKSECKPKFAL